MLISHR
jgi:hypothetical protein